MSSDNDHHAGSDGLNTLRELLCSISEIPEAEWTWLASNIEPREYPAQATLFRPGAVDHSLHFLSNGLVRYYYLTDNGLERNHTFAAEHSLVACLRAFAGVAPCQFAIEALEPTRTLLIPADIVRVMDERHACWLKLKLRLMEHVALRKEAREAEFLLESAPDRYRLFRARFSALEDRIPQYHIASYLGITPVALSRIRKRINHG